MPRRLLIRLVILLVVGSISYWSRQHRGALPSGSSSASAEYREPAAKTAVASQTWGHPDTLADHFDRHGGDFHARDAEDYAAQAAAFLARARATGLPARRDTDGSLRIYDQGTNTFGAYNANGTTRTFFKPDSAAYFDHQPGERVDLRSAQ